MNKSLTILRLGNGWFSRLVSHIVEAGRTESYVETTTPSQADTLHKEVKWCDEKLIRRAYEKIVRMALKIMRFGRVKVAIDYTEEPYWGKNGLHNTRARVHEKSDESWQHSDSTNNNGTDRTEDAPSGARRRTFTTSKCPSASIIVVSAFFIRKFCL